MTARRPSTTDDGGHPDRPRGQPALLERRRPQSPTTIDGDAAYTFTASATDPDLPAQTG